MKKKYTVFCDGQPLEDFEEITLAASYSAEHQKTNPNGNYEIGIGSYDPLPDVPPSNEA